MTFLVTNARWRLAFSPRIRQQAKCWWEYMTAKLPRDGDSEYWNDKLHILTSCLWYYILPMIWWKCYCDLYGSTNVIARRLFISHYEHSHPSIFLLCSSYSLKKSCIAMLTELETTQIFADNWYLKVVWFSSSSAWTCLLLQLLVFRFLTSIIALICMTLLELNRKSEIFIIKF